MKLLEMRGFDFARVNYFMDPLSEEELAALLGKAGLRPRDVLRKREKAYKELGLDDESLSDADLLKAIVDYPSLLQRPIVVRGERAVLGRPIEAVSGLL